MNEKELLELGFVDTSYVEYLKEGKVDFTEFKLTNEKFTIEISGIDLVEMSFVGLGWIEVPNCKTIEDLKCLIKLFNEAT